MSYVPPHKRLPNSQQPCATSENRCAPQAMPKKGSSSSRDPTVPQLVIRRASGGIWRFMVVGRPCLLKFEVFRGESFAHLSNSVLYTVGVVENADQDCELNQASNEQEDSDEVLSRSMKEKLSLQHGDKSSMDRGISGAVDRLAPDFIKALKHLSYVKRMDPDVVHPKVALRFGRVLFTVKRPGTALAGINNFDADSIERALQGERGLFSTQILKTFDNGISLDYFHELKQVASAEADQVISKERYTIQIEDDMRPDYLIKCVCILGSTAGKQQSLTLKKIKVDPVRHMVNDILYLEKKMDLRVILSTENHLLDLSEEERASLNAIVNAAIVDEGVKGGLRWPLGCTSAGNRFSVQGAWHRKITVIKAREREWKFQVANRAEFKASTGRFSYEVDLKIPNWKDYVASVSPEQEDDPEGPNDTAKSAKHHLHTVMDVAQRCI